MKRKCFEIKFFFFFYFIVEKITEYFLYRERKINVIHERKELISS